MYKNRYCPRCYTDQMYAVIGLRYETNYKCADCKQVFMLHEMLTYSSILYILRDRKIEEIIK